MSRSVDTFGLSENSLQRFLRQEPVDKVVSGKDIRPRQVKGAHYTPVLPEPVPSPYFVAGSRSCAESLDLDPSEIGSQRFIEAFSGNALMDGLNNPYCIVYGCHVYGQWFGQLGDGRAVTIGEIFVDDIETADSNTYYNVNSEFPEGMNSDSSSSSSSGVVGGGEEGVTTTGEESQSADVLSRNKRDRKKYYGDHVFELQLKGAGRSPYSRGFDGRAVLRSTVREFLVSEAMHHLGVATTRALSIIGTGQDIMRAWYDASSEANPYGEKLKNEMQKGAPSDYTIAVMKRKFPPNKRVIEPGAVMCRVSKSFLRFAQLELFAQRGEKDQLLQLADYVCFREYPELLELYPATTAATTTESATTATEAVETTSHYSLLPDQLQPGPAERYVALFRMVAQRCALLVTDWMRVGYVQGNMNSDNILLGGRTIDYGPYGWMEAYDPFYQPFTSDSEGKFCFSQQPQAMGINIAVLGESAFKVLLQHVCQDGLLAARYYQQIQHIATKEYAHYFKTAYNDMRRRKLGFKTFSGEQDGELWANLERLLYESQGDYTIFFRELGNSVRSDFTSEQALAVLQSAFYLPESSEKFDRQKWLDWLERYLARIKADAMDAEERRDMQNNANPKFVLRNWMSTLAYERAEQGNYSTIGELTLLLEKPYSDSAHSPELVEKWYKKTPDWAKDLPGVTFMS